MPSRQRTATRVQFAIGTRFEPHAPTEPQRLLSHSIWRVIVRVLPADTKAGSAHDFPSGVDNPIRNFDELIRVRGFERHLPFARYAGRSRNGAKTTFDLRSRSRQGGRRRTFRGSAPGPAPSSNTLKRPSRTGPLHLARIEGRDRPHSQVRLPSATFSAARFLLNYFPNLPSYFSSLRARALWEREQNIGEGKKTWEVGAAAARRRSRFGGGKGRP